MAYQSQSRTQTVTLPKPKLSHTTTTLADVSNQLAADTRVTKIHTQSLKPLLAATLKAPVKTAKPTKHAAKPTQSTDRVLLSRPKPVSLDTIHSRVKVVKQQQPLQLSKYLIDQTPATLTHDSNMQTDRFVPEQAAQPYIPAKTGTDAGTQIDSEVVYQYDRDIEAINNNIVHKVLEQCLTEVRQEQELAAIKLERQRLTAKHAAEAAAIQKLEIESAVRLQQKQAALQTAQQHAAAQHALHLKLQANRLAWQHVQAMQLAVFEQLHSAEYFVDADRVHAQQHLTSSVDAIAAQLQQHTLSQAVTDTAVAASIAALLAQQQAALAERAAAEHQKRVLQQQAVQQTADARARSALIELYVILQPTELIQDSNIGPLYLTCNSTVAELQAQINNHVSQLLNTAETVFDTTRIQVLLNNAEMADTTVQLYDMQQNNTLQQLSVNILPPPAEPVAEPTEPEDSEEGDEASETEDS